VRCFTATCENKKFQHGDFLLSTLAPHLTELSKVLQAGCFYFEQVKTSVEPWAQFCCKMWGGQLGVKPIPV